MVQTIKCQFIILLLTCIVSVITYVARVRFGILVRDSVIFEKVGAGVEGLGH